MRESQIGMLKYMLLITIFVVFAFCCGGQNIPLDEKSDGDGNQNADIIDTKADAQLAGAVENKCECKMSDSEVISPMKNC